MGNSICFSLEPEKSYWIIQPPSFWRADVIWREWHRDLHVVLRIAVRVTCVSLSQSSPVSSFASIPVITHCLPVFFLPSMSVQGFFHSSGISGQPHVVRRSFMGHCQGDWNAPCRAPALVPSSTGIITPFQQPAVMLLWYRLVWKNLKA